MSKGTLNKYAKMDVCGKRENRQKDSNDSKTVSKSEIMACLNGMYEALHTRK